MVRILNHTELTKLKKSKDPSYDRERSKLRFTELVLESDGESICSKCGIGEFYVFGILKGTKNKKFYGVPNCKSRSSNICSICSKVDKLERVANNKKSKKARGFIHSKHCKVCSSDFNTTSGQQKYCSRVCTDKSHNFKNLKSYDLSCKHCSVDFTNNRKKDYCSVKCLRDSKKSDILEKECLSCEKHFTTRIGSKKFCSTICSRTYASDKKPKVEHRKCNSCDSMVKLPAQKCDDCKKKVIDSNKKQEVTKDCHTCEKEFNTSNSLKIYCKSGCSPVKKEANKLRKQTVRKAKIPVMSWKSIVEFKEDRPDSNELDHIIPLNHPDVCGLHVTWNFQWLSKYDNGRKSNKFDGTVENDSWRK